MKEVIWATAWSIPDEFSANAPKTKKEAAVVKTVTLKRNWLIVFMCNGFEGFLSSQAASSQKEEVYYPGTGGALKRTKQFFAGVSSGRFAGN